MIQTLWIYSARNQWFTNGIYKISVEISHRGPFSLLKNIVYQGSGIYLHREDLEIGSHRDLARRLAGSWKPHTPEEINRLLSSPAEDNSMHPHEPGPGCNEECP